MSLKIEEMQMGDEFVLVDYKGLSEAWDLNEKVFNALTVMDRLVFAGIDHKRTGGALIEGAGFAISKEHLKFFKRKANGLGDQKESAPKIEPDLACAVARAGWITDKQEVCFLQERSAVNKFVVYANVAIGEEVFSVMEIEEFASLTGEAK